MKRTEWAMLGLVVLLLVGGCMSDPETREDPTYEETTVEGAEIEMVRPPFFGQTMAVVPYVNKSLSRYRELGSAAPDILAAYVIDAGFRAVEGQRGQLDAVMEELSFGQTDMVRADSAARIGQQLGARYVLLGAVTDYRETKSKAKKGLDVLGLAEIGGDKETLIYDVQVSTRIVNVETREIVGADAGTKVTQKYSVEGGKFKILGVGTRDSQKVQTERETLGTVLKLAFAKSLNRVVNQINRRAAMMAAPPPAPGQ